MINSFDISGALAVDAQSVDRLRLQAKKDPDQALKGAARQFEALFMNMLLKSMREATPQDGPFNSEQTRLYTSLLDQQLAQNLSAKGIGLADIMIRQLTRAVVPVAPQPPAAAPAPAANPAPAPQSGAFIPPAAREFVNKVWNYARDAGQAIGIPAQFVVAQAALESGWGRHEIRRADGNPSFNLFGIKAGRNWSGPVVETVTTEHINGTLQKTVEKFRAYDSYAEAFRDYGNLLRGNPRYAAVLDRQDAAGFARGLQQAGYATDPMYADKLMRILQGNTLRLENLKV
ncbi:MAG: flagellar assembly peptidoglycan hydrolase FlgJ [Betaproteobacteria bacterium]|nr:flagellar assembly peptidoglycan hydrolase FlgJ [Betaproteobacteria bacterium]